MARIMDYSARAPYLTQRRASAIHRFDVSRRDLRTQIAPDVKSKYDSLSLFPHLRLSLLSRRFHRRNELPPAICIRASAVARAVESAGKKAPRSLPFNLRGIILRMPRLVALLDEEENKLYSQVFSRGLQGRVGRTPPPAERRAEGPSMRTRCASR